jgi:hypothetical protein
VWFRVLSKVKMQCHAPGTNDEQVTPKCKKGFSSLVMLITRWLWKHRNACVFEEVSPSTSRILQAIEEDAKLWCIAGAVWLRVIWP